MENDQKSNLDNNNKTHHFEQLDVEVIDNELQQLLLSQKTSKLLIQQFLLPFLHNHRASSSNNEKDVISLLSSTVLKSIIYFLTIGYNDLPTPAMSILGLNYDYFPSSSNRHHGRSYTPLISKLQKKILFYTFSILLPCIEEYIRNISSDEFLSMPETNMNSRYREDVIPASTNRISTTNSSTRNISTSTIASPNSSIVNMIGHQRRKSLLRFIFVILDLGRVINYIQFLINPTDIPPLLSMRILGIVYCRDRISSATNKSGNSRMINYLYAYRRILYSELLRCFVSIFPRSGFILVFNQISKILQISKRTISNFVTKRFLKDNKDGDSIANRTDSSKCPICQSYPIFHPYVLEPCGHVYCYVCLRNAMLDDVSFSCNRCGTKLLSSRPLSKSKGGKTKNV